MMRAFIISLCLLCAACSAPSTVHQPSVVSGKIKVLSTTAMIDDIVGLIGRERIDHFPLITGEIDPHSYELVKGDDEKLKSSELIFYNGLGLEHGASLRHALESHLGAVNLGEQIQAQYPKAIIQIGREVDPHIWMDISLWSYTIDPIVAALVAHDPEAEDFYTNNARELKRKMHSEHAAVYAALHAIAPEKRYLVTSHDAFNYFTRAYLAEPDESQEEWQKRCDAPEGISPDGQLSAANIQEVIDHLIAYHICVVFPESNVSRDSLKKIVHACRRKGLDVQISSGVLYGDAMGKNGYLDMIWHDASVLVDAWEEK